MIPLYLGIYIFICALLWGFFFLARHHAYRFHNFSTNIKKVTFLLSLFLLFLTISGFILIFFLGDIRNTVQLDNTQPIQKSFY